MRSIKWSADASGSFVVLLFVGECVGIRVCAVPAWPSQGGGCAEFLRFMGTYGHGCPGISEAKVIKNEPIRCPL